jgi:hypothetical protein
MPTEGGAMSQGPYPPGYEPADGAPPPGRQPYEPYEGTTGRASARVPQQEPDWPAPGPQRSEGYANPPGTYGSRPAGSASVPGGYPPPERGGQPGTYGGGQPTYNPGPGQYGGGAYGEPSRDQFPEPGRDPYAPGPGPGPGQYGDPGGEPSRFGNLRYDEEAGPPPAKSKRGLIIGVVVAAVAVIVLAAVGVTYFMSSSSSPSYAAGTCVRKSGDNAVSSACSASGAYQITSKVDNPSKCADPAQPYVILQEKGKADQVLCLKPAH